MKQHDKMLVKNPANCSESEIGYLKNHFHKLVPMPYKCKESCIEFSLTSIQTIMTQYGSIREDNGYHGKERYYFVLQFNDKFGGGSTKYDKNFEVKSLDAEMLEEFGKAIVSFRVKWLTGEIDKMQEIKKNKNENVEETQNLLGFVKKLEKQVCNIPIQNIHLR